MTSAAWQLERDNIGFIHRLPTGTLGYFVKVEKTVAGDYSVTATHIDDPAGGELEYLPNLTQAKRRAEELVASGEWVSFTLDEDRAKHDRDADDYQTTEKLKTIKERK
ncbi:MAG: hypothetical protein ACTHKB_00715 [Burkholderiaceae bacterium]